MQRWNVSISSSSPLAGRSLETIGSGVCISNFFEGPDLSALHLSAKRELGQQDITVQQIGDSLRLGFSNSVKTISDAKQVIWNRTQEAAALNFEIITLPSPLLTFELQNGDRIQITSSPLSWKECIRSAKSARLVTGILAAHFVILGLMTLHLAISHRPEEPSIDLSQVEVQLQTVESRPTPVTSTNQAASSEKSWAQMIKGMKLRSSKVSLGPAEKTAPAFPQLSESSRKDFFNYEVSAPEVVSGANLDLNANQIADSLRPYQARLKDCYSEALFLDAQLRGRAQLLLNVKSVGQIESLEVRGLEGSPQSQQSLRRCFQQVLTSARLPSASQDFAVSQSLVLYQ